MNAVQEIIRVYHESTRRGFNPQTIFVDFATYKEGFDMLRRMTMELGPDAGPFVLEEGLVPNYAICGIPIVPL